MHCDQTRKYGISKSIMNPYYDFVANYILIQGLYHGFTDAVLSHLVSMHQAPGASCGILYLCLGLLLTLARACAAKGYCSRSVCRSVGLCLCVCLCSHVFSPTVAAVDTKHGYVGMCNGRSAQQERRCPRTACLRRGHKIIYSYYARCALIRDRRPTAWDGFARPAETEATCIWEVSPQIVVGRLIF